MEVILKRDNGNRVKIECNPWYTNNRLQKYNIRVYTCAKGKRKFIEIKRGDHVYRSMSLDIRRKAMMQQYLEHVTSEEIYAVCLEIHKINAPSFKNIEAY